MSSPRTEIIQIEKIQEIAGQLVSTILKEFNNQSHQHFARSAVDKHRLAINDAQERIANILKSSGIIPSKITNRVSDEIKRFPIDPYGLEIFKILSTKTNLLTGTHGKENIVALSCAIDDALRYDLESYLEKNRIATNYRSLCTRLISSFNNLIQSELLTGDKAQQNFDFTLRCCWNDSELHWIIDKLNSYKILNQDNYNKLMAVSPSHYIHQINHSFEHIYRNNITTLTAQQKFDLLIAHAEWAETLGEGIKILHENELLDTVSYQELVKYPEQAKNLAEIMVLLNPIGLLKEGEQGKKNLLQIFNNAKYAKDIFFAVSLLCDIHILWSGNLTTSQARFDSLMQVAKYAGKIHFGMGCARNARYHYYPLLSEDEQKKTFRKYYDILIQHAEYADKLGLLIRMFAEAESKNPFIRKNREKIINDLCRNIKKITIIYDSFEPLIWNAIEITEQLYSEIILTPDTGFQRVTKLVAARKQMIDAQFHQKVDDDKGKAYTTTATASNDTEERAHITTATASLSNLIIATFFSGTTSSPAAATTAARDTSNGQKDEKTWGETTQNPQYALLPTNP